MPSIHSIITHTMTAEGLDIRKIDRRYSNINVHCKAFFRCYDCHKGWTSKYAWVSIDLWPRRFMHRWAQKCKSCLEIRRPYFEDVEKIVKTAIKLYRKRLRYGRPRDSFGAATIRTPQIPIGKNNQKPHRSDLCEKCNYGNHECWHFNKR